MKFNLPQPRLPKALTGLIPKPSASPRVAPANAAPSASKFKISRLRLLRPRRATIMSCIRVSATIVGQVGSAAPVPMIQPIADGVKNIVEYCETVRMHKQECIELKDLVIKYANALERATEGKSEDGLDEHLAYSLAELDDELVRIRDIMQKLSRNSLIKRIVSKGEYVELLSKHRKELQDAIVLFQTEQVIRSQINVSVVTREVKRLGGSVYSIGTGRRPEGAIFLTQKPSLILGRSNPWQCAVSVRSGAFLGRSDTRALRA